MKGENVNNVILLGHLTRDPEIKYSQGENGIVIVRYTLAINRKQNKENAAADFINCVAFPPHADFAERYLHKGTKILVSGRIETGSYTNKDGIKVYTTQVIVENQELVD